MTDTHIELKTDAWNKRFLFSVIVPVYNTEEYVEETIQSVIGQSIGFERNIQLILVNNCTPDNAGQICEKYAELYPNNIVYVISDENRGASGGRNAGIPYIRGKYVNFLDSDDKWDRNALKKFQEFFEKNEDIDIAAARMKNFGAYSGWFYDDWRFRKTMVCDIFEHPDYSQFWISGVVMRASLFPEHSFDETAKYSEDMKLINEIIIPRGKYGLVREAVCLYRRRESDNKSQVQMQKKERYWYFGSIKRSYLYLAEFSKSHFGCVINYVKHIIIQELQWRIQTPYLPDDFTEQECDEYYALIKALLEYIDDYIILNQKGFWKEYKVAAIKIKYGDAAVKEIELRNNKFVFRNLTVMDRNDRQIIALSGHDISDGILHLKAVLTFPLDYKEDMVFACDDSGKKYPMKCTGKLQPKCSMGRVCMEKLELSADIPLSGVKSLCVMMNYNGIEFKVNMNPGNYTSFDKDNRLCCYNSGENSLRFEGNELKIYARCARKFRNEEIKDCIKNRRKRALYFRLTVPRLQKQNKENSILIMAGGMLREMGYTDPREIVDQIIAESKPEKVYIVCDKVNEWLLEYGTPLNLDDMNDQKKLFLIKGLFSFSPAWDKAVNPLGWHNKFVKDMYQYKYIDKLPQQLIPTTLSKEQMDNA